MRRLFRVRRAAHRAPAPQPRNGAIDEAYVFDRALSEDEVVALKENSWRAVNVLDPTSDLSIEAVADYKLSQTIA